MLQAFDQVLLLPTQNVHGGTPKVENKMKSLADWQNTERAFSSHGVKCRFDYPLRTLGTKEVVSLKRSKAAFCALVIKRPPPSPTTSMLQRFLSFLC